MALKRFACSGFRNLADCDFELSDRVNLVFGPNASGKTNLLEAIHVLAVGRSFRPARDADMLSFTGSLYSVAGSDESGGRGEVRFDGSEKRVALAGNAVGRLSDFLGWLPVVVLLLDDIDLVAGPPSGRRQFLDMAIAKLDRSYIRALAGYRRALAQCNRLLERGAPDEQYEAWSAELARQGVPVVAARRQHAGSLLGRAERYYEQLTGERPGFCYRQSIAADDPSEGFRLRLAETRERSRRLGLVLAGPHRDDLVLLSGGRELRRFGSVGEQRLAATALRLAEADELARGRGCRPVLLADEVLAELDDRRSALVSALMLEKGQLVYAAARRPALDGKAFEVEKGKVQEVQVAR